MRIKVCRICGKEFSTEARNQVICKSQDCYKKRKAIEYERCMQKKKEEEMRNVTKQNREIDRIEALARLSGMSYGIYVSKMLQKN